MKMTILKFRKTLLKTKTTKNNQIYDLQYSKYDIKIPNWLFGIFVYAKSHIQYRKSYITDIFPEKFADDGFDAQLW